MARIETTDTPRDLPHSMRRDLGGYVIPFTWKPGSWHGREHTVQIPGLTIPPGVVAWSEEEIDATGHFLQKERVYTVLERAVRLDVASCIQLWPAREKLIIGVGEREATELVHRFILGKPDRRLRFSFDPQGKDLSDGLWVHVENTKTEAQEYDEPASSFPHRDIMFRPPLPRQAPVRSSQSIMDELLGPWSPKNLLADMKRTSSGEVSTKR